MTILENCIFGPSASFHASKEGEEDVDTLEYFAVLVEAVPGHTCVFQWPHLLRFWPRSLLAMDDTKDLGKCLLGSSTSFNALKASSAEFGTLERLAPPVDAVSGYVPVLSWPQFFIQAEQEFLSKNGKVQQKMGIFCRFDRS